MDIDELVTVRVSPFDVSSHLDSGYRSSNSVSGSRFDAPIRDLPFAIQAFNQTFIDDQQPETIFDVAKYSPGVTYRSNDFNEGNANVAIRGFAVGTYAGSAQIFRDGVRGPSILDFTNVARLEIVKGPSSFLYGQLAPGGVVNVITKSPLEKPGASARIRYGSYQQYRFDGDVTGPIAPGLLYRVVGSLGEDMHYWQPYDGHSADIAPSVQWSPNSRVRLTLKGEYFRKREAPQIMQKPGYARQKGTVPSAADPNLDGVDVPGLPDDWSSASSIDYRNSNSSSVNATMDMTLSDRWSVRVGYAHQRYATDAVFSGNFGMLNSAPFMQGRRLRRQTYTNRDDTFGVDVSGTYRRSIMSLRVLLGAQYLVRRFDQWAAQAPNDPALTGPVASPLPDWDLRDPSTWNRDVRIPLSALTEGRTDLTTNFSDQAAYGSTTFGFFDDRLLVLAGLRLTRTTNQRINYVTQTYEPEFVAQKLSPHYGVLYKLPFSTAIFASYAESFVPAYQTLRVLSVDTTPAVPTEGRGVDIGAKVDLWRGRVSGTVTFFDIRNRNIPNDIAQLDPTTGQQVFTTVQSGEQRSRGIEIDATLTPIDNWQTYLSYSYNDARITEFSGRDAAILAQGPSAAGYREVYLLHNAPLQMSAPHLANLWTRFSVDRGRLHGLFVGGGANLVVRQTLLPDTPAEYRQTYTLYNAMAGYSTHDLWPHHPVTIQLTGKNLANEHYRPSQSTRSRPREILLSVAAAL